MDRLDSDRRRSWSGGLSLREVISQVTERAQRLAVELVLCLVREIHFLISVSGSEHNNVNVLLHVRYSLYKILDGT